MGIWDSLSSLGSAARTVGDTGCSIAESVCNNPLMKFSPYCSTVLSACGMKDAVVNYKDSLNSTKVVVGGEPETVEQIKEAAAEAEKKEMAQQLVEMQNEKIAEKEMKNRKRIRLIKKKGRVMGKGMRATGGTLPTPSNIDLTGANLSDVNPLKTMKRKKKKKTVNFNINN